MVSQLWWSPSNAAAAAADDDADDDDDGYHHSVRVLDDGTLWLRIRNTNRRWFGVAVTAFVTSTKLNNVEPG